MIRTLFPCLLLLTALALGCSKQAFEASAEVSGVVTYHGKPVPGGVITFTSEKGYQNSAAIDEHGHFTIEAGVGSNKVTVDNRQLKVSPKVDSPRLKLPEGSTPASAPVPGTYVMLPDNYTSTERSKLTYTVTPGAQTKDFVLE